MKELADEALHPLVGAPGDTWSVENGEGPTSASLVPLRRLYLLRGDYLFFAGGISAFPWPDSVPDDPSSPW
jgi:hypothetical protein